MAIPLPDYPRRATILESTIDGQNAQRNILVSTSTHQVMVCSLCQEHTFREGEEPTLDPVETFTNQDLAHVLISIAAELLKHPHQQRLPIA